jgi:hypothetical protein
MQLALTGESLSCARAAGLEARTLGKVTNRPWRTVRLFRCGGPRLHREVSETFGEICYQRNADILFEPSCFPHLEEGGQQRVPIAEDLPQPLQTDTIVVRARWSKRDRANDICGDASNRSKSFAHVMVISAMLILTFVYLFLPCDVVVTSPHQ